MPAADVAFDRVLLTPEYLANPYRFYHELQERAPVYFSERMNGWIVTRYSDVAARLLDRRLINGERVSSFARQLAPEVRAEMRPLYEHLEKWIGNMDPPDHTRLRSLVGKAFTPRMIRDLAKSIEGIADRLLDAAEAAGRMDFVHDFAYPLPATVIGTMLGLSLEEQRHCVKWAYDITAYTGSGSADPSLSRAALASVSELSQCFLETAAARRAAPRPDLITALVQLEDGGDKLSETELVAMCTFLLVAGHETTMALLANGLVALLGRPEQEQALRADPALAESAVEEFLRFDSPIQQGTRVAAEALDLAGTKIEKGQRVMLMFGAANRDPAQFPEPDRLDLRREPNKHLAFGLGHHFCLGAHLARLEAHIAFPKILKRFPNLRLEGKDPEWRRHTSNRNPVRLDLSW